MMERRWKKYYAASSTTDWALDQPSLAKAIELVCYSDKFPVKWVASYEELDPMPEGKTGFGIRQRMPYVEDEDVVRNLEVVY